MDSSKIPKFTLQSKAINLSTSHTNARDIYSLLIYKGFTEDWRSLSVMDNFPFQLEVRTQKSYLGTISIITLNTCLIFKLLSKASLLISISPGIKF